MQVPFIAFQGAQDDGIYLQNATPLQPNLGEEGFWYDRFGVEGFGTSTRPALAQIGSRMVLAWKAGWNDRWPIPNVGTSHGPSLCTSNGQLFMAWKGNPGDTAIWYSSSPSGAQNDWSPQQAIGPSPFGQLHYGTSVGPALATLFA